ncbi:MAG TPA: FAD-binding oxidoreductase [Thermoleophilaceae bacterium]|nr:FAD-binding oxidoreductase [Thermoleophilaceae bacterium]
MVHDTHIERHSATGWWLEEAGRVDPLPPLSGSLDADVVVVGGGYTGMWTAWRLLDAEPSARVVLLEGGVCGHGPSGRNGGFCESLWFSAAALRERFGDEPARRLLDASSRTVAEIGAWCRDNDVDAWFDQSGYMCVSTGAGFDDVGRAAVEAAAALGAPEAVQELSPERVRERCTSPLFRRGVLVPDFATVQPARLALGLRRRLIERGVRVFEGSRVRRLRGEGRAGRSGRAVVAETSGGSVRAGAAVLGVGAVARSIAPLRSRLTVTSSHIVLTEPVPELLEEIGWTGGECITDGRTLLHYFRTTRDGRIALGWGGGRIACGARLRGHVEVDRGVVAQARADLERLLPGVRGRRIEHAWGGPIDVSPSHIPQVGTLPGAPVHFAFGFTGNGVGPSRLAAGALASLALERRDEHTRLPIVGSDAGAWVPPEPLAWLGGAAVRAALVRVERAAEQGRRADPLSRAIRAAPRAFGLHLAR